MDNEQLGGDVGDDGLAEASAFAFLHVVGLQGRRARRLDARDLSVGSGPGNIDVSLGCVALV